MLGSCGPRYKTSKSNYYAARAGEDINEHEAKDGERLSQ